MSEWKEIELGQVADVRGGKRLPKGEALSEFPTNHPYIRTRDIANHKIKINELLFVPDDIFSSISNYTVEENDLIISIVGTIGLCAVIPKELHLASLTENCAKIVNINNKQINRTFLFYYLISEEGQAEIESRSVGSTQPKLPLYNIKSIKIPVPPLPEQRAIASVLSSLDDKIDLLHRENKTLEAMAETLFRQWFVVEAEKGWKEIKLEKYVECVTGCSYKSIDLNPSNIALVTLKNFARDGSFRMDGFKEYTGDYKKSQIVKQGDLVVAHTDITQEGDIIGNPVLIINPGQYKTLVITMDLMKVESTTEWLSKEFLYYLFKTPDFKFHCLGCSNGTTVLHMSRNAIPSYELKIPNKEKVIAFTKRVRPIIEKKFTNISQIRTLEKLRDTLLPKLMSGEVRIQY